jgi:hypothetical protein
MYQQSPLSRFNFGNWLFNVYRMRRVLIFGLIIFTAMLSFELFNYSTTDFALRDLLGNVEFMGVGWATILSIAFCGIDFAGIARLFTPEKGRDEPAEVWYLLAAWFLAATMNALLTWWGISLQVLHHNSLGNEIMDRQTLLSVVPIFVAVLVWLIRILLIGTLSIAGERLFSATETAVRRSRREELDNRWSTVRPSQPAVTAPSVPRVSATPSRLLAEMDDDDDYDQRRTPNPTYTRPATPMRPAMPPPSSVRPAPKPATSNAPGYGSLASAAAGDRPYPNSSSRSFTLGGEGHEPK